jgi:DNA polymerase III subunit epsilon
MAVTLDATGRPGTRRPWRQARFAVVDVETTGLDPHVDELLSVGVVPIDEGRIQVGRSLYVTVRAARAPEPANVLVHGIRPIEAATAPTIDEVAGQIVAALDGRIPVAHVARIERAFLGPVLKRHGARLARPLLDTDRLVRWLIHREEHRWLPAPVGLSRAAAELGLPVHRPHHALGDALTTAQVFLAVAGRLERTGPVTPQSLRNASRRLALAERMRRHG